MINNGDPENHLDIVQLLIDHGVDLNAFDEDSFTTLMSGKFILHLASSITYHLNHRPSITLKRSLRYGSLSWDEGKKVNLKN